MGICFPALHDRGSLNWRLKDTPSGSWISIVSVAVETAALVGMFEKSARFKAPISFFLSYSIIVRTLSRRPLSIEDLDVS